MPKTGKCALCLKNTELVKSHIYPEFQYKPLYDSEHKYMQIYDDGKSKSIKKKYKGIYEHLLCDNCDRIIIGGYEDHASKVLFGDGRFGTKKIVTKSGFLLDNVDYRKFKLFQISLLWRTAATKRPEIPKINLGSHFDKMRKMLLNGNPGNPLDYGCAIFFVPNMPKELVGLSTTPKRMRKRIEGNIAYNAIFNGFLWIWLVSSQTKVFSRPEVFLNKNGKLPIFNSGQKGWKHILDVGLDMVKQKYQ